MPIYKIDGYICACAFAISVDLILPHSIYPILSGCDASKSQHPLCIFYFQPLFVLTLLNSLFTFSEPGSCNYADEGK